MRTLNKVIDLRPEHISSYSLIIEEGTPFFDKYGEGKSSEEELPAEEVDRDIYHKTRETLELAGYHQYEISNYSLPGYECKHNIGYWTRVEYVGFGIGAASLVDETRWKNCTDIEKYIEAYADSSDTKSNELVCIKEDIEKLNLHSQMEEYMFLGLRLIDGVSVTSFKTMFGGDMLDVAEYQLHTTKMLNEKLLILDEDRLRLSSKGIDVANYVMSGYIFD